MDLRLTVRYRADTALIVCVGRLVYGEESASLRARVKGLIAQGAMSIVLAGMHDHRDSALYLLDFSRKLSSCFSPQHVVSENQADGGFLFAQ